MDHVINIIGINEQIENIVGSTKSLSPTIETIQLMLKDFQKENTNVNTSELKKIEEQIKRFKTRLDNAQSLMLDGELSMGEYKTMKANIEAELDSLTIKKLNLPQCDSDREKFLAYCLDNIKSLGNAYSKGSVREKQLLLGSVFEEKLVFPEKKCRTPKFNKVISLLFTIDKGLRRNKNGIEPLKIVQSRKVEPRGVEPLSKHTPQELSTCLFLHSFLCISRSKTNQPIP